MPSSNKTPRLRLNQWLGSDKPRREDFNADNLAVENAVNELSEGVNELELQAASAAAGLEGHLQNNSLHLTEQEKALVETLGEMVIGQYTGDGQSSRTIQLGFRPRFGLVYGVAQPFAKVINANNIRLYGGFYSAVGCTHYLELAENGFQVRQVDGVNGGHNLFHNETGVIYCYVMWK